MILLVTDGNPTREADILDEEAQRIIDRGIRIVGVGVTNKVSNNSNYKNKNWRQFLFIVKAAVLKPQISKFYPQIQRTEARDHIYFSQRPFINVKAIFCA